MFLTMAKLYNVDLSVSLLVGFPPGSFVKLLQPEFLL